MHFFADTAYIEEIRALSETGLLDGVTTNPSLLSKVKGDPVKTLTAICECVTGPVSAEVIALNAKDMVREGLALREIAENIVIKLPLTQEGLKATRILADQGHPVNVTLCFSAGQALLAAKAGARFISPFVGRLDDIGIEGMQLIEDMRLIFDHYPKLTSKILTASVRHTEHIRQAALLGSDAVTIPPALFYQLIDHPLTRSGLEVFLKDWSETHQSFV